MLAPIGADVEREAPIRCGQPVGLLLAARRLRAGVKRERTVGVALEVLVLGAEREALEVVGVEEMLVVVQGQRPEAVDRRLLPFRERDLVTAAAVQLAARAVEVGVGSKPNNSVANRIGC